MCPFPVGGRRAEQDLQSADAPVCRGPPGEVSGAGQSSVPLCHSAQCAVCIYITFRRITVLFEIKWEEVPSSHDDGIYFSSMASRLSE